MIAVALVRYPVITGARRLMAGARTAHITATPTILALTIPAKRLIVDSSGKLR
jgi:hypothetical protein